MTAAMRAVRAHGLIGPPGLWVDEIPGPARPDEDAGRINVHTAGVGFLDTLVTAEKPTERYASSTAQLKGEI